MMRCEEGLSNKAYEKGRQEKYFLTRTWIQAVRISLPKTSIQVVKMILVCGRY
jgi:hypothetical protein